MKKSTSKDFLQEKRERKNNKRKRRRKTVSKRSLKHLFNIINRRVGVVRKEGHSALGKFLDQNFYDEKLISSYLEVPEVFCLESNNKNSILFIKKTYSSFKYVSLSSNLDVTLSFKNCKELRLGPLMLLNVIIVDFYKWKRKMLNRGVPEWFLPNLKLFEEMDNEINNLLCTMHFPLKIKKSSKIPIFGFRLIEGKVKAKDYRENSKGKISKNIRKYINDCIQIYGIELNHKGRGVI